MQEKIYSPDQIDDAKKLADALINTPKESRSTFSLIVEAMLIGAEIAERATSNA